MNRDDFDLDIQVKNFKDETRNVAPITTAPSCTCNTVGCPVSAICTPPVTTWVTCPR